MVKKYQRTTAQISKKIKSTRVVGSPRTRLKIIDRVIGGFFWRGGGGIPKTLYLIIKIIQ
jgi:hypothetical protein